MRTRAAATISLSGPLALQGRQAARGLQLWASADQIELEIVDEDGNPVVPRSKKLPLAFGPIGPAERGRAHAQAVIAMDGFVLTKYGDHAIHFIVNGTHNGSVRFHVLRPQPSAGESGESRTGSRRCGWARGPRPGRAWAALV